MARSPYLEAKVNRWCKEKMELVIDDCDPATLDIIVDYMYGSPIPESVMISSSSEEDSSPPTDMEDIEVIVRYGAGKLGKLLNLLQMSDKLLMVDLKGDVEELLIKVLKEGSGSSWILTPTFLMLSENYDCQKLLLNIARHWCKRWRSVIKDNGMDKSYALVKKSPKFAAALLVAFGELP